METEGEGSAAEEIGGPNGNCVNIEEEQEEEEGVKKRVEVEREAFWSNKRGKK